MVTENKQNAPERACEQDEGWLPVECDLSRNERNRTLIAQAQSKDESEGERALDILIRENTGLVRSLALRFCGRGTE